MLCQQCNANLAEGANFCHICGAKQEKKSICSACGNALIAGAKFCFNCGAAVGGACATTNSFSETTQTSANPFAANATVSAPANPFAANKPSSEPFFKKWIAEHKDDAERLEIEWISQFKGEYAVAILKDKRYAIVRSSGSEITVAYVSKDVFTTFAAVGQDCEKVLGNDCFGNGLKYAAWATSDICDNSDTGEYITIIESFTGQKKKVIIREDLYILCFVFDYNGNILVCKQSGSYLIGTAVVSVLNNEHYALLDIDKFDSVENVSFTNNADNIRFTIFNFDGTPFVSQIYLTSIYLHPEVKYISFSLKPHDAKYCIYDCSKCKFYLAENDTCYELIDSYMWQDNASTGERGDYIIRKDKYTDEGLYIPTIMDRDGKVVLKLDYCIEDDNISILENNSSIFVAINAEQQDEEVTYYYSISKSYGSYKCEKAIRTTDTFYIDKLVEIPSGVFAACSGGGKLSLLNTELQTVHQVPHDGYSSDMGYYVLNNEIYCLSSEKDNLGGTCQVVTNINTGESFKLGANRKLVIKAEGEPAEDGGRGYHSEYNDDFRYSFGCITAYDEPYFLVGDSGKLNSYYIREGGCGLVDKHGRWIIPYSDDILFITQRDYLPANTFYVCCFDYIRKVYDANGTLIAQGRFDDDGKVNELRDNYEGCCKLR